MILAIDVGNTNIVIGWIDNGNIKGIVRIRTDTLDTAMGYAVKLKQILEFENVSAKDFDGAILSSVVPQLSVTLKEAVEKLLKVRCLVVGPGIKTGMNVRIDDPNTLAGDLVVGSVAALHYYGAPVIVLDMGTATTIVVIDKDNAYRGGAIMAGVRLSLEALSNGTSLLPDVSISAPKKCIATNTVDSMRSGAVFGAADMIDGMVDRMEAELGYKCNLVATGGLAPSVTKYCRHEFVCDDNLLLKGLWYLYSKNR